MAATRVRRPAITHLTGARRGQTDRPTGAVVVIGRSRGVDVLVHPDDDTVGRRHARLTARADGWWVEDLGSRTGTCVDGVRLDTPRQLVGGELLSLGPHLELRFELTADVATEPHRPPSDRRRLMFMMAGAGLTLLLAVGLGAYWVFQAREHRRVQRSVLFEALVARVEEVAKETPVDKPRSEPVPQEELRKLYRTWAQLAPPEFVSLDGLPPLEAHVAEMLALLTGQPPERRTEPAFLARVESEVLGLLRSRSCYCRWKAMRPELIERFVATGVAHAQDRARFLTYIPWIESCYRTTACSMAAARGMWQFIPATAREYGLRVDNEVDERCDWEKATPAAARYFDDAFARCGEDYPLLVVASYNTGTWRACQKIAHNDAIPVEDRHIVAFIAEGYLLPETIRYVPRFVAASFIGEHPEAALAFAASRGADVSHGLTCDDLTVTLEAGANCPTLAETCPDQRPEL